jgi:hypothetical protein
MLNDNHCVMMAAMMAAMMHYHHSILRLGRLYYRYAGSGKNYCKCD